MQISPDGDTIESASVCMKRLVLFKQSAVIEELR